MYDVIVISDIHLGSAICQDKALLKFLKSIELNCKKLIINGDLFDHWNFIQLSDNHWKILKTIRKVSSKIDTIWIRGNHDGPSDIISHLLGVDFLDEYYFKSGNKSFIVIHGDIFDRFICNHKILTKLADEIYRFIQQIDSSFYWSRLLKQSSKTFLRATEQVQERAIQYCLNKNFDAIICSHTHVPLTSVHGLVEYYNTGSWTYNPCTYLSIKNGMVELHNVMV